MADSLSSLQVCLLEVVNTVHVQSTTPPAARRSKSAKPNTKRASYDTRASRPEPQASMPSIAMTLRLGAAHVRHLHACYNCLNQQMSYMCGTQADSILAPVQNIKSSLVHCSYQGTEKGVLADLGHICGVAMRQTQGQACLDPHWGQSIQASLPCSFPSPLPLASAYWWPAKITTC